MQHSRYHSNYDEHFAALRKLDSVTLMHRGRVERARAMRIVFRQIRRKLRAFAGYATAALVRRLRRAELARYDERLLRDMGIAPYDAKAARGQLTETLRIWLDRSQQRKRLAGFRERDLHDIALSKCDADAEIGKPFWRA